jgi:hypothetical protein
MTQINMNGRQSFLLNDIKDHVRNGGNVTHILYVKVSNASSSDVRNRIRQAIVKAIGNISIQINVNGSAIAFTWRIRARPSSAYYHCDTGIYNDIAVKEYKDIA